MAKSKIFKSEIVFRPAKPSDAEQAGRLLFETFPKEATFIIGLGNEARAKRILAQIFSIAGHRLSYELAKMALYQDRVIGMAIIFPGRMLGKLNRRLGKIILRQYGLRGKLALIIRSWPLVFIKETARDEFYLSNLAVKKRYRSQGVGGHFLSYIEEWARQSSLRKVSLMVSMDNQRARRLYERNGYVVKALYLESNKRVPYLGHGDQRMVKELAE